MISLKSPTRLIGDETTQPYLEDIERALLQKMGDGVILLDARLRVLYVNEPITRFFGNPEPIGLTFESVVGAEDSLVVEEIRGCFQLADQVGEDLFQYKGRMADGQYRWCEIRVQKWETGQGAFIVNLRDLGSAGRHDSALRESEEKFSKIFNTSSNAMAVTDYETGVILDVNPAWVASSGITRDEALGKTALQLGIWPNPEVRAACVEELREKGTLHEFETELMMQERSIPFLVSAEPLEMGSALYALWEFRNIAAQREADAAIRRSEEKYRALVETAHDLIWSLDTAGRWTFVNRRGAMAIYGLEPEEMLGRYASDFLAEPRPDVRAEVTARIATQESTSGHETKHRAKDGRIVELSFNSVPVLNEQGVVIGSAGTARDITEKKAAERALSDTAQRLSLAQLAGHMGVWEWNAQTSELVWDDRLYTMFGYKNPNVVTPMEAWRKSVHPDDRDRAEANLFEAIRTGNELHDSFRVVAQDGQTRHIESHAIVVCGQDGDVQRVIGLNADITNRHKLEEQVRLSQKMEAVGQLAGGIAHDFNNLLSVIIGYSDIVLSDMPSSSPFREDIEQVLKAANRAAGLTRQLLAFSRRSMMEMKTLDLNQVVEESETMLRRLIGEVIVFESELSEGTPRIKADPNQLIQVIMNLVVNARDAMPLGGHLLLKTELFNVDQACAELFGDIRPGRYASLSVVDTGIGFSSDLAQRIFEPFFTTKPPGKGTGLGLSVAHGIIRQSGGHIDAESTEGEGATFRVLLPASDEPQSGQEGTLRGSLRGDERILLVEDEDAVRSIAQRALTVRGYRVIAASNGTEALRVFHEAKGEFDLLLADVVMPGISGYQLSLEIQAFNPSIRTLFVSGYTDDEVMRHGVLEGETRLLQKPFTANSLAEAVRACLDSE